MRTVSLKDAKAGFSGFVDEAVKGSNITIGPGYKFHVVPIGNLQVKGPCVQSK